MSTSDSGGAPRTLADQLRGWPDERLARLLEARPDLGVPVPQNSAQLATRLATRPAVVRALDALSLLDLTVLEAALHEPTRLHDVVHAEPAQIDAAVDRLLDLALLWGTPDDLRPVTVLAEVLGSPAGPPIDEVARLLDGLSRPARALLDHLDERDADGRFESVTPPLRELVDRRLLHLREDRRHATVPWSVRVALRGGRSTRERVDVLPDLATSARDQGQVDRAAAGAAFELVRRTELLLDHWGSHPPAVLRAGGLGVRDLRAAATLLAVEPSEAGLVIETAACAGLLAPGAADEVDPGWLPTDAFDVWLARGVADRWATLAVAWLATIRLTGLVGGKDEADRTVNALTPDLERVWLPSTRRAALEELPPAGEVLAAGTGLPSLLARLRWRAPRRPDGRERAVTWAVEEAAIIGLTGLGGFSGFGRALLTGSDPAKQLISLLPRPVDHVLIQADLTAIAPGPLDQDLARNVSLLADVESRGGATTYRFSASSVRRAFDAGWSGAEVKDFLTSASRTPVPQALDYLVDDVSRRFGTLRTGAVEAFLRSDDETALTALVNDSRAEGLRLRRIAPTVVVSDVPLHVLLPRLRELGHAPVVEAADGTVRVARPDVFRARTRRRPMTSPAADQARLSARVSSMVTAVRSGDRVVASRPHGERASSPGDVLALLSRAAEIGNPVRIGYVDGHGRRAEEVVRPTRVESGQLVAQRLDSQFTGDSDDLRVVAVHRIAEASLVTTPVGPRT